MKKRFLTLGLLLALAIITFLDRISISVAAPRIQDELHIPPDKFGWILGAFVLAYGLFEIPTGALGDRLGQRRVLTRIVLWWSGFTALTGAATGFWPLLVTRFLFGAGEAGAYPNASGVVARWFPFREHARTQGFIWAASRFGGALSPLLVVPLQRALGWRMAFFVLAAVGTAWAVVWRLWFHDDPRKQPGMSAAELAEIPAAPPIRSHKLPWARMLASPQLRLIMTMYWCYAWGSWFYFAWFPTYLVKAAGFTEKEMGIYAALPFLMGTLGNLAGGFLSDRMVAQWGLRRGRVMPAAASLAGSAALLVAMTLTHDKTAIVILSSLGFGVADLMLPMAWAVCLDIGHANAGLVTGAMNTAGQLGGFVCSVAFGYVVTATHSYRVPVWIIAGLVTLAAYLFTRINPEKVLELSDAG
ncbi:MAG TPA: MFS transporter [Bryobacteraceae bacterium]|nr:MFS transporter [Bryobacteraceae bacterium]